MTDLAQDAPAPAHTARSRRDFRLYLSAHAGTTFGSVFTGVAVAAIAVELFGVSGGQAGQLAAGSALPALVVAPLAGLLADRATRPRLVLMVTDLAAALIVGSTALAVATGMAGFGWLLAMTVALGCLAAVTQTLFLTHLNSLRTRELHVGRAHLQTASYLSSLSANAVAGPIIAALGPVIALAGDAVSYLGSAAALRSIAAPDHNPAHTGSSPDRAGRGIRPALADILAGFRILARRNLRPILAYSLVAQSAFAGIGALRALYLLQTLDIPLYLYSVPGFAAAALAAAGSVVASRVLRAGRSPARFAAACWSLGALLALVLPAAGGPTMVTLIVASAGLAIPVMCYSAANIAVVALFSAEVPDGALGRVSAAVMMVATATAAAGALTAGYAADVFGVRPTVAGCTVAGVTGLLLLRPLLRRRQPVTAAPEAVPAPAPPPDERSR